MINGEKWIAALTGKLLRAFGPRLRFTGLQGSYRRGEATEDSDIDAVVILDHLRAGDLDQYRAILRTMPEHQKACGFFCGADDLAHWPAHELFQFRQDTQPCHGSLDCILPAVTRADIVYGLKVGASALYHSAVHSRLHGEASVSALRAHRKNAFFLLQLLHYLRSGVYAPTRRELLAALPQEERALLGDSRPSGEDASAALGRIALWSGRTLRLEFTDAD